MAKESRGPTAEEIVYTAQDAKFIAVAEAYMSEAAMNRALARKATAEAESAEHQARLSKYELESHERSESAYRADNYMHRVYNFVTDVNELSCEHAIGRLTQWHRMDTEEGRPNREYEIVFNSPGGSVTAGLALFDHIRYISSLGHKITTGSIGYAASMGGVLLQAGDYRWIGREAYLMIHELAAGTGGKVGEMKDDIAFYEKICARIVDLFVDRSGGKVTKTQFKKLWERHDWWLSSDEALKFGFVDAIR